MFTKHRLSWAAIIAAASLAAACNGSLDSASPTSPSASNPDLGLASALSAAQATALAATCGGSGTGAGDHARGPAGTPPPGAITGGPGGLGPGDRVTNGTPPSSNPSPGNQLAVGGSVTQLAGTCPAISFIVNGKRVRTSADTSFGASSCGSLRTGDRIAAVGATQSDGSVLATCVATGIE